MLLPRAAWDSSPPHTPACSCPRQDHARHSGPVEVPKTGRQLYAILRKAEEQFGVKLLSSLNKTAKGYGISGRTIDWTPAEVEKLWPIAESLLAPIPPSAAKNA